MIRILVISIIILGIVVPVESSCKVQTRKLLKSSSWTGKCNAYGYYSGTGIFKFTDYESNEEIKFIGEMSNGIPYQGKFRKNGKAYKFASAEIPSKFRKYFAVQQLSPESSIDEEENLVSIEFSIEPYWVYLKSKNGEISTNNRQKHEITITKSKGSKYSIEFYKKGYASTSKEIKFDKDKKVSITLKKEATKSPKSVKKSVPVKKVPTETREEKLKKYFAKVGDIGNCLKSMRYGGDETMTKGYRSNPLEEKYVSRSLRDPADNYDIVLEYYRIIGKNKILDNVWIGFQKSQRREIAMMVLNDVRRCLPPGGEVEYKGWSYGSTMEIHIKQIPTP